MSRSLALPLQLLAAGAALCALTFTPPADGEILLIPIAGQSGDSVTVWATAAGAQIVGIGPLPGSLVVRARAGALIGTALRHGVLAVAAAPAGCGSGR